MFASKNLFSEIICPYSQSCVLPRCIFKHDSLLTPSIGTATSKQETYAGEDQETPRKRQKIEENSNSNDVCAFTEQNAPTSKPLAHSHTDSTNNSKPLKSSLAATRPVSPPPLKKNIQSKNSATINKPSTQDVSKPKLPSKTPTKSPAKAPIKAEGLNPRALKTPTPASHDMRFRLLRALHEQFVRLNSDVAKDASATEKVLVLSDQALITRALDIEEDAAATPIIYSNIVKNKILLYKRMSVKQWVEERGKEVAVTKTKDNPRTGPKEPPKPIETGLTLEQELQVMKRLQTHISSLSHAGFTTTPPTAAEIASALAGVEAAKNWEVCDRCRSRFQVFPSRRESDGALASGGACNYHPGKAYFPPRDASELSREKREKRYRCCNEGVGESVGCTRGENHVFKISEPKRLAAVLGFECTPDCSGTEEKRPVCVDGEMGYTTYGLELIRLTATRWPEGATLLDVLVKPVGLILDLNSRYSGVWPKDFATALPYTATLSPELTQSLPGKVRPPQKLQMVESPAVARDLLFKYLSPSTSLIGHGLENDLNAMRIIHPTIVDTALLFPHKAGLPFRNGLKALMSSLLGREIQVQGGVNSAGGAREGDVEGEEKGGHDSKEDANAAGDLVRHAIKEEWGRMRRDGWIIDSTGKLASPAGYSGGLSRSTSLAGIGMGVGEVKILVAGEAAKKRSREEVDD